MDLAKPLSLGNYSHYSFHRALWSVEELVSLAAQRGYGTVGLSDIGGFYGAVSLVKAGLRHGVNTVLGCRLWSDAIGWLQFTVRSDEGYRKMNRFLTANGADRVRDERLLAALLADVAEDLWVSLALQNPCAPYPGITPPRALLPWWLACWRRLLDSTPPQACWLELGWRTEQERSAQRRLFQQLQMDGWQQWVIMSNSRMAATEDAWNLELWQSIGTLTRVGQRHPAKLEAGCDGLMDAARTQQQWRNAPAALHGSARFVAGCTFELPLGRLHLPGWDGKGQQAPEATDANRQLARICLRGLVRRYRREPYPWPEKPTTRLLLERLKRELSVIRETGYAGYFLIFHAIVSECCRRGTPLLARGSAAGSLICFALGVSNVCPFRFGLSFERFLNLERMRHSKLPDIDLDLPWDERDAILQWVYARYGGNRVAMIGGFNTLQARGALAEVAKAVGLPAARAHALSKRLPHGSLQRFLQRADSYVEATPVLQDSESRQIVEAALALDGLPRHPMMHPCGAVIADQPLTDFLPLHNSAKGLHMTQMDMHGVEDLGLLKLDLLGQAGLSVLRDVERNLRREGIEHIWQGLDLQDPELYRPCAAGEVRGIFHIESPAMIGLQRLCRCADIDCLVAVVSVIRPGAANEDKKLKFARRYLGLESPQFAHPVLQEILTDTYGLLIFEEQILFVAHRFAGLDYGKADQVRRLLIKQKDPAALDALELAFKESARAIGRDEAAIATVWHELRAFSGFMFNKAHGAAYAVEAARGLWLKRHWPIHFLAAVLNNRRGFYQPLVYVLELLRAGARIRLPSVQQQHQSFNAAGREVFLPLWQIKGLGQRCLHACEHARAQGGFRNWRDFCNRVQPDPSDALLLARSGALDCFFDNRHAAVWHAGQLQAAPRSQSIQCSLALFEADNPDDAAHQSAPSLPPCPPQVKAQWEAELMGFPVSLTPFELWLPEHIQPGVVPIAQLAHYIGREVEIRGLVIATRSHHTVQGELMKFISLADATGIAECTLFPQVYRQFGAVCYAARWLQCRVLVEPDATQSGIQLQVRAVSNH